MTDQEPDISGSFGHASGLEATQRPAKRPRTDSANQERISDLSTLLRFWLSAANLSKDKFLVGEMRKDKEGWIPASLFLTFRKVRALSVSEADVVIALRALNDIPIELNASKSSETKLRVVGGLPALKDLIGCTARDEDGRTVYVETLPSSASREALIKLFSPFGTVSYVSIPRFPDGKCKGFAFVEFENAAGAEKLISASIDNTLSTVDFPALRAVSRAEWRQSKEEYKAKKRARRRVVSNEEPRGQGSANADIGQTPPPVLAPQQFTARQSGCNGLPPSTTAAEKELPIDESPCSRAIVSFEPGLIVAISGLDKATKKVTRPALYELLEEYGPLAYIDYSPRNTDVCKARYVDPSGASRAVAALAPSGGSDVLGSIVSARTLTGNQEMDYWIEIENQRKRRAFRKMDQEEQKKARRVGPRIQPTRCVASGTRKETATSPTHKVFSDEEH